MTTPMWRMPARIAVSGTGEWLPVERVDVRHVGGGAQVTIETWPVADLNLDQSVADHATALAGTQAGWTDLGVEPASVIGRDGRRRRAQWLDGAGDPLDVTIGYRPDDLGMVVVTIATREGDAALAQAAVAVAGSITVDGLFGSEAAPSNGSAPPARDVDDAAWAGPARSWMRADHVAGSQGRPSWITFEEALATASRHGARSYPGVRGQHLSRLDPAQAALAVEVGRRAINARLIDDPALAGDLEVAAAHDLLVVHEQVGREAGPTRWLALRPDRAVVIETDAAAARTSVRALPADDLVVELLDGCEGAPPTEALVVARADLLGTVYDRTKAGNAALEPLGEDIRAIHRVRSVARSGEVVTGGEVQWLDTGSRGSWRIVDGADPEHVELQPMTRDGMVAALVAVLPGG